MMKEMFALALMLSLSFAWSVAPSSCQTQYSVLGVNFTYAAENATLCAAENNSRITGMQFQGPWRYGYGTGCVGEPSDTLEASPTHYYLRMAVSDTGGDCGASKTAGFVVALPSAGNYTLSSISSSGAITFNSVALKGQVNITDINTTSFNVTNGTSNVIVAKSSDLVIALTVTPTSGGQQFTNVTLPFWQPTTSKEISVASTPYNLNSSTQYLGINKFTNTVVHSDFRVGVNEMNTTASYCRNLLYFNNPYYGNIQLIPKITYIPGVDAFPDLINSTDNSAYTPNGTMTYIYDSVTGAWYIVPATTCASFTTTGSISTLQYDPTGTSTTISGTVPISVYLSGSCTYNAGTRLVTCNGTDSSGTITNLYLSAYLMGNTTDRCAQTAAGASGVLTCTLPAVNGTYNIFFYGTDADLLTYHFSQETVSIGSAVTGFGRDGYIAALIMVVIAAMLFSGSIAISMALGCFGLFVALAFGVIPLDGNIAVAALFAVVGFALSYRLRV